MPKTCRLVIVVAASLTSLNAQSLDRLVLKEGDILVGHMRPSTCGSLSFRPEDGLSPQSPSIDRVSTVRVGNYVLSDADTSSKPSAAQIADLQSLLNQESRPAEAVQVTLSLSLT